MNTTAIHLLHRAGQTADDLVAKQLEQTGLTTRQLVVLQVIASAKEISQTGTVDATGIDRSTIADIVRRLVERNLLTRQRTEQDTRMYAVTMTTKGEKLLEVTQPIHDACETCLLEAIPSKDRAVFVRSLRAIVDTFGPISSAKIPEHKKRN